MESKDNELARMREQLKSFETTINSQATLIQYLVNSLNSTQNKMKNVISHIQQNERKIQMITDLQDVHLPAMDNQDYIDSDPKNDRYPVGDIKSLLYT
jgi:chromosome segregation ATPase